MDVDIVNKKKFLCVVFPGSVIFFLSSRGIRTDTIGSCGISPYLQVTL